VQAQFNGLRGVTDAIQIDVVDRWRTGITVPKRERRAGRRVAAVQCFDDTAHEGRLPSSQLTAQGNRNTRPHGAGEFGGDPLECSRICSINTPLAAHAQRTAAGDGTACGDAKTLIMWWRANDVLVGVITGVVVAIVAAAFEALFVTIRFLSFGAQGGGVGSRIVVIAFIGAIVGGLVGLMIGAVIKPRTRPIK